jgi:hypothetical protein
MLEGVYGFLGKLYGEGEWLKNYSNNQFFLNHELAMETNKDLSEMRQKLAGFVVNTDGVANSLTAEQMIGGSFETSHLQLVKKGSVSPNQWGDEKLVLDRLLPGVPVSAVGVLAAGVLAEEVGLRYAENYRAWQRAQDRSVPLIVLIVSGLEIFIAKGFGKTVVGLKIMAADVNIGIVYLVGMRTEDRQVEPLRTDAGPGPQRLEKRYKLWIPASSKRFDRRVSLIGIGPGWVGGDLLQLVKR